MNQSIRVRCDTDWLYLQDWSISQYSHDGERLLLYHTQCHTTLLWANKADIAEVIFGGRSPAVS